MDFLKISLYCLDTIKTNIENFIRKNGPDILSSSQHNSKDVYFDALFYLNLLKDNLDKLKLSKNMSSLLYNLKAFRTKIAHQGPITIRQLYRYVDDTQILIENLNVYNIDERNNVEFIRKEVMKVMINTNDNTVILGNANDKYMSSKDMDLEYENEENKGQICNNSINGGIDNSLKTEGYSIYNDFTNRKITDNLIDTEKINKLYERIKNNNEPNNFI